MSEDIRHMTPRQAVDRMNKYERVARSAWHLIDRLARFERVEMRGLRFFGFHWRNGGEPIELEMPDRTALAEALKIIAEDYEKRAKEIDDQIKIVPRELES